MAQTAEAIARRLIEEGFNNGSIDVADELIADEIVEHQWYGPNHASGPEGVKAVMRSLRGAFSDFRLDIEDITVADDTVWLRMTGTGTNDGPYMGNKPGRPCQQFEIACRKRRHLIGTGEQLVRMHPRPRFVRLTASLEFLDGPHHRRQRVCREPSLDVRTRPRDDASAQPVGRSGRRFSVSVLEQAHTDERDPEEGDDRSRSAWPPRSRAAPAGAHSAGAQRPLRPRA